MKDGKYSVMIVEDQQMPKTLFLIILKALIYSIFKMLLKMLLLRILFVLTRLLT